MDIATELRSISSTLFVRPPISQENKSRDDLKKNDAKQLERD